VRIEKGEIQAYLKIVGEQKVDLNPSSLKSLKPPIKNDTEMFQLATNERINI
jgi:hypothetical protein